MNEMDNVCSETLFQIAVATETAHQDKENGETSLVSFLDACSCWHCKENNGWIRFVFSLGAPLLVFTLLVHMQCHTEGLCFFVDDTWTTASNSNELVCSELLILQSGALSEGQPFALGPAFLFFL